MDVELDGSGWSENSGGARVWDGRVGDCYVYVSRLPYETDWRAYLRAEDGLELNGCGRSAPAAVRAAFQALSEFRQMQAEYEAGTLEFE